MPHPRIKTRKKTLVFSVAALIAVAATVVVFVRKREAAISVQTDKVTRRSVTELVVANGRIQPVVQVKISPEVSGEIIELPVKEGQHVKKGDLLVKIKPDIYIASRNSSEASYKASLAGKSTAEATLQKTEAEFRRIDDLFKNQLVSESNYVEARTAHEIAKAQVESSVHQVEIAKAALAKATEDLAKTTITSPLNGTVSRLNSQLGERVVGTAMMAGTEIMTVADLNEMEARVDIGEIDVVLIAVGQSTRLEVDAFKNRKFNGTVTEIANSSKGSGLPGMGGGGGGQQQEATKFEVKIRVSEKEIFRPGMSVTAEIETRYRTNVLTVPIQSVTTRLPKDVAEEMKKKEKMKKAKKDEEDLPEKKPGSKKQEDAKKPMEVVFVTASRNVKMVPVKLGISDDAYVEIVDGLTEGQEVVSGGYKAINRELEDGKKIKVDNQPKPLKADK